MTSLGIDLDLHCLPPELVAALVEELRAHARHEEAVLYPWAERCLGHAAQGRLVRKLSEPEPAAISGSDVGEWQIESERSSLRFALRHIVISKIYGRFTRWGGAIVLDEDDLTRSSVRVWIDLASVDTGDVDRDAQIRSAEFFDVARFPRATFASRDVNVLERGAPVVQGQLDLHGRTHELSVEITSRERWTDQGGALWVSFGIRARFDRRTFGLRWNQDLDLGGVVVGDEIEVEAQVEAQRLGRPTTP
jgi:polyisoprenoid-binding protein YceI